MVALKNVNELSALSMRQDAAEAAFRDALAAYHRAKAHYHTQLVKRPHGDDDALGDLQAAVERLYTASTTTPEQMIEKIKVFKFEECDDLDEVQTIFVDSLLRDLTGLLPGRVPISKYG